MRINPDGTTALLKRPDAAPYDSGTWNIGGDKFCRYWQKIGPQHAFLDAVRDGKENQILRSQRADGHRCAPR